jgi:hypothetical protein
VPDPHPHFLFAQEILFEGVRLTLNGSQWEVGAMFAGCAPAAFRFRQRCLAEFLVVLQPHQSKDVFQSSKRT